MSTGSEHSAGSETGRRRRDKDESGGMASVRSFGIARRLGAVGRRASAMGEQIFFTPGPPVMTASLKDVMSVTGKGATRLCTTSNAFRAVEWMTPAEVIGFLFWCSALSLHPHNTAELRALRFHTTSPSSLPQRRAFNATHPAVLMGGTLRNGCPAQDLVPAGRGEEEWVPASAEAHRHGGRRANGWYFVLESAGAEAAETMEVSVEGLRAGEGGEEEEEWVCLVGQEEREGAGCVKSVLLDPQTQATHNRRLRQLLVHGDPAVAILAADLRAPLAHVLGFVVVPALRGAAYFAIATVGYLVTSATHLSDAILGWLHLAVAALLVVAGALEHGTAGRPYLWWYVQAAATLSICVGVVLGWRGLVALQGVVCLCCVVCQVQLFPQRSWLSWRAWWVLAGEGFWLGLVLVADGVMMCAALYLTVRWRYTVHTSENMIQKDKLTYDAVWNQLLNTEAEKQGILELQSTVAALHATTNDNPRQRDFQGVRDLTNPERRPSEQADATSMIHADRVRSLDQLYAQARVVDILLREKVKHWAQASNGYLRAAKDKFSKEGSRWIKWTDCEARPELKREIVWGGVKKVDRSIQKILRSYNGDVSRLVDISRGCIAFKTVKDICECVRAIAADADAHQVCIVRVKNRLSPHHDSATTAGYRDVAFNIRLVGDAAMRYGVSSHVAEIQLILLPFAQVKTNEGHQRYVQFRNLRAE